MLEMTLGAGLAFVGMILGTSIYISGYRHGAGIEEDDD